MTNIYEGDCLRADNMSLQMRAAVVHDTVKWGTRLMMEPTKHSYGLCRLLSMYYKSEKTFGNLDKKTWPSLSICRKKLWDIPDLLQKIGEFLKLVMAWINDWNI